MKYIRDPLLQFLLIGAVFFAVYLLVNPSAMTSEDQIVVDAKRIELLATKFNKTWQRPPTQTELKMLVDNYVLDEIYYRRAIEIGIDKNDEMIRRRLRQKMEFISDSIVESIAPSEEALALYFVNNSERYRTEDTYSFQHIYLNTDREQEDMRREIQRVKALLVYASEGVEGDKSLVPKHFNAASRFTIDKTFGQGFSATLDGLEVEKWSKPISSGIGIHFIRLTELKKGYIPTISSIREQVVRDWRYQNRIDIKENMTEELMQQFQIIVDWPKLAESQRG
jgi:hypothetical protein